MSEVRADVDTAYEDPTGVVFHVEMPGRRIRVHLAREALIELGAGEESGALADFARQNRQAIQLLVNEAAESGWGEPLHLMT